MSRPGKYPKVTMNKKNETCKTATTSKIQKRLDIKKTKNSIYTFKNGFNQGVKIGAFLSTGGI